MTAYTKNTPGAPVGRYAEGDLVVDSLDNVWKCVVPGSEAQFALASMQYKVLTAAASLDEGDSGRTYILNSTADIAVTLPALQAGLEYEFVVAAVPATAAHTITPATADKIVGRVFTLDGGVAGDTEDTPGGDAVNFVTAATVIGDRAVLRCDGTNWLVEAHAKVPTGITITG